MTRHVSEETLLKMTLGLLDPKSELRVRHHLERCAACRDLRGEADRTVSLLQSVTPDLPAELPVPIVFRQTRQTWLRIAAMLLIGFGLGYLASESLRPSEIIVVPQQLLPRPPATRASGFVECEIIDLRGDQR